MAQALTTPSSRDGAKVTAQKGTPYPELRDDHDLSQKERALRNELKALYPTIEDAANALGIDLERFAPHHLKPKASLDIHRE